MSTRERSPAFLFYGKDWLSSLKVRAMTFEAKGMFIELLIEQWQTGAVPATPGACASLIGGTEEEWTRAWPKLVPCFSVRKRDGLLVNRKLEAVRRARLKYQKVQAESGLRGARARWKTDGKPIGSPSEPNGESMANDGRGSASANPSVFPFRSAFRSPVADERAATPAPARAKKPVFQGKRIVVFGWQVEDLKRMLGVHALAFDLGGWLVTVDARAQDAAVVMPPRDLWAWLQGQTLAEAQRRGLPIAVPEAPDVSTAGKQTTRLAVSLARIKREEEAG